MTQEARHTPNALTHCVETECPFFGQPHAQTCKCGRDAKAARLRIADAAPEMLEALKGFLVGCEWREAHDFGGVRIPAGWSYKRMPDDEALTKARAAIRKAEGRT